MQHWKFTLRLKWSGKSKPLMKRQKRHQQKPHKCFYTSGPKVDTSYFIKVNVMIFRSSQCNIWPANSQIYELIKCEDHRRTRNNQLHPRHTNCWRSNTVMQLSQEVSANTNQLLSFISSVLVSMSGKTDEFLYSSSTSRSPSPTVSPGLQWTLLTWRAGGHTR